MTSGAYDELRSRGQTEPALPEPPAGRPRRRARRADRGRRARRTRSARRRAGEAAANRELIAAATELDPAAPADAELLDRLAGLKLETKAKAFAGPECERYREALQRGPGGGRGDRAGAGLRAAAGAGQRLRPGATRG